MPIIPKSEFRKPSVWRSGRLKIRRRVSAASMANSEYFHCPPRLPTPAGSHAAMASGDSQIVTSPRRTSARSYSAQLPTRYFVLYFGCTLDFMPTSWPVDPRHGQSLDPGSPHAYDPCTNACAGQSAVKEDEMT